MPDFKYIIVGAGMMGAAAARHLSAQTGGVALIGPAEPADRKVHQGVFSSHYDEARITRGFDGDPVWAALAKRSIARYAGLEAKSGVRFFTEAGCLFTGNGWVSRRSDMMQSEIGFRCFHSRPITMVTSKRKTQDTSIPDRW